MVQRDSWERQYMTRFRGCIDIHKGQVKQIVGSSLTDDCSDLKTNFSANLPIEEYVRLFRDNEVTGSHIIKLGPGCDDAAKEALYNWPNKMQIGGGIDSSNASMWIALGAEKIIVTSYLFPNGQFSLLRLKNLCDEIGKDRITVDLSCTKFHGSYFVATNRWQTITDLEITKYNLDLISNYCNELLIHATDVEGLRKGIDKDLVSLLGRIVSIPCTYAGGANQLSNLKEVHKLSNGKLDLTIGSALDIFGGDVCFLDCVNWNRRNDSE